MASSEPEAAVLELWNLFQEEQFSPEQPCRKEELRTALRTYSNALVAAGDLRGKLIALDLADDFEPPPDDPLRGTTTQSKWEALIYWRRSDEPYMSLVAKWLGENISAHENLSVRYGLISVEVPGDATILADLIKSAGGQYLESVAIFGTMHQIQTQLDSLAGGHHDWLRSIYLFATDLSATAIENTTVATLREAAPSLRVLGVSAHHLFRAFAHPSLRRLWVDGYDAIASLCGSQDGFPGVVQLALSFHRADGPHPTDAELDRLLSPSQLPSLRELHLSSNERWDRGGQVRVFKFLRRLEQRRQLTHVWLPSLRSSVDIADLQAALADMASLKVLSVAGNYAAQTTFEHPSATLEIPSFWPWPPRRELKDDAELSIRFTDGSLTLVKLTDGIAVLERAFGSLTDIQRAAWTRFWNAVRKAMESDAGVKLPLNTLALALTGCGDVFLDDTWRRLVARIQSSHDASEGTIVLLQMTPS